MEWPSSRFSEGEAAAALALAESMGEQVAAQDAAEGYATLAGTAFRFDEASPWIPGVLDLNEAGSPVSGPHWLCSGGCGSLSDIHIDLPRGLAITESQS